MIRVVLDTNILISALLFPGSKPDMVVALAREGKIQAFTSPLLMQEFARVLVHKLQYERTVAELVVWKIAGAFTIVHPSGERKHEIAVVNEDWHVLECALDVAAQYVVTGDRKHLLPLQSYDGIRILSHAEFLNIYG